MQQQHAKLMAALTVQLAMLVTRLVLPLEMGYNLAFLTFAAAQMVLELRPCPGLPLFVILQVPINAPRVVPVILYLQMRALPPPAPETLILTGLATYLPWVVQTLPAEEISYLLVMQAGLFLV